MRYPELRPAASSRQDGPTELVIIGHVGFATDQTASGSATYPGGSGFAAASAAAALLDSVGLVAQVGEDFNLDVLEVLRIGIEGVSVLSGATARFRIEQPRDGSLSFGSDLGVATEPSFESFPVSYLPARYVHLGSAPPYQQLAWLEFLRAKGCQAQISVDMFEPFVAAEPQACRETCARADLIFVNDAEYRGLYDGQPHPSVPVIRKYGPGGAELLAPDRRFRIPAPPAHEVDPIGAGEILAGAFLALRARGLTEEQALAHSVAAAARSVTEFGVARPAVIGELERVRATLGSEARVSCGSGARRELPPPA